MTGRGHGADHLKRRRGHPAAWLAAFAADALRRGPQLAINWIWPAAQAFAPFRDGIGHARFLACIAEAIEARTYFEIGTSRGDSLAGIGCAAVCVDPDFRVERDVIGRKPALMAFQMTSDAFFAAWNLRDLLPAPGRLDLAFLDGMHHFEFLLRDFINTERASSEGSVIVLHDCLPPDPEAARRRDRPEMPPGATSSWSADAMPATRHCRNPTTRWSPNGCMRSTSRAGSTPCMTA